MAAILRVKRKKEDEPLDALIISCKRQKVECEDASKSDAVTAIVKFAGTVEKPVKINLLLSKPKNVFSVILNY